MKWTSSCALVFFCISFSSSVVAYDINELILKELKHDGALLDFKNVGNLEDKGVGRLAQSRLLKRVKILG